MIKHIMVCVSGFSGSGKDESIVPLIQKFGAIQTGLADPAKRHMADVYRFSKNQLFGPSKFRNSGDMRLPKNICRDYGLLPYDDHHPFILEGLVGDLDPEIKYWWFHARIPPASLVENCPYIPSSSGNVYFVPEGDPRFWLSPREALQKYCELMNDLDENTWIRKGVEDQVKLATDKYAYDRMVGVIPQTFRDRKQTVVTCFADFRHIHEVRYIKTFPWPSNVKAVTIRIKRSLVRNPPYKHRSETEQLRIRDGAFDFVVNNDSTIDLLHSEMIRIVDLVSTPSWEPKLWEEKMILEPHHGKNEYTP